MALADCGGRRDSAGPTAALHSIAEETRGMCWRMRTDEHFCRRKGRGDGSGSGRYKRGIIIRKRNRCRYLCREIAVGPISVWLTHKSYGLEVIFESIPPLVSTRHAASIEITLSVNHTIQ